jgi:hypothetical protein
MHSSLHHCQGLMMASVNSGIVCYMRIGMDTSTTGYDCAGYQSGGKLLLHKGQIVCAPSATFHAFDEQGSEPHLDGHPLCQTFGMK